MNVSTAKRLLPNCSVNVWMISGENFPVTVSSAFRIHVSLKGTIPSLTADRPGLDGGALNMVRTPRCIWCTIRTSRVIRMSKKGEHKPGACRRRKQVSKSGLLMKHMRSLDDVTAIPKIILPSDLLNTYL